MCRQNSIPGDFSSTKQRLLKITIGYFLFCVILSPVISPFFIFIFHIALFSHCSKVLFLNLFFFSYISIFSAYCQTLDLKEKRLEKDKEKYIFFFCFGVMDLLAFAYDSLYLSCVCLGRPGLFVFVCMCVWERVTETHRWLLPRWDGAIFLLLCSPLLSSVSGSNSISSWFFGSPSSLTSAVWSACCLLALPTLSSTHGQLAPLLQLPRSLTLPGLLPCAYPLFSLLASLQRTVTVRAISMDST